MGAPGRCGWIGSDARTPTRTPIGTSSSWPSTSPLPSSTGSLGEALLAMNYYLQFHNLERGLMSSCTTPSPAGPLPPSSASPWPTFSTRYLQSSKPSTLRPSHASGQEGRDGVQNDQWVETECRREAGTDTKTERWPAGRLHTHSLAARPGAASPGGRSPHHRRTSAARGCRSALLDP